MKTLSYEFSPPKISCNIFINPELFLSDLLIGYLKKFSSKICIITDLNIKNLYGDKLLHHLRHHKLETFLQTIIPGEESKSRHSKAKLEDFLTSNHFEKDSCLIALGGGVVSDLTGFLASTYLRSIPYISIPTTLLSAVDAAIGGKTAVNTVHGKNLIGAFHHPLSVFIDPDLILSSPLQELKNGLAEVFKYSLIFDLDFFNKLNSIKTLSDLNNELIVSIVEKSLQIKTEIIKKDPFDQNLRKILNFGHSLGHALETASNHRLSHGQAVVLGILSESFLSKELGFLTYNEFLQIYKAFENLAMIPTIPNDVQKNDLVNALLKDKKNRHGKIGVVILKSIGKTIGYPYTELFSLEQLETCIDYLLENFQECPFELSID